MTIQFDCPSCGKLLKTTDDKAGMRAKCPGCGEPFEIPTWVEETEEDAFESDFQDEEGDDYRSQFGDGPPPITAGSMQDAMKACPMCGEQIKAVAIRCRYCGEDLGDVPPESEFRPTPIDAADVISKSWQIYKSRKMGICIGGVFLAFVINFMASLPSSILQEMMERGAIGQGAMITAVAVWFMLYLLGIAVQLYMTLGVNILLLKVVRGQGAEIGDLFNGGQYFLRMLGSSLLFGLAVVVGLLLFIVPGIIVALMFWPYGYVLVDQNPSGIDCLSRAKQITHNNWGAVFLIGLISISINLFGALACCVGLIFTVPLTTLMLAVAYCRMTGQRIDRYRLADRDVG